MSKVPREQLLEGHLNVLRKVASGVAHQSKSPLNSIAINAFILREKLSQFSEKKRDGERLFSCLASIDSDVRRLDSMLDMFFHFVRDDPKPESFSLPALAQECVDLLYHLATKHNCPLSISSRQEIEAFGNKSQVRRIIVSTVLALMPTNSGLALELKGSGEKISVGLLAKAADPANPITDPLLQLAAETTTQLDGEFRADSTEGGRHYFQISIPVSSEKPSDV